MAENTFDSLMGRLRVLTAQMNQTLGDPLELVEFLTHLLEVMPSAVIVADVGSKIVLANAQASLIFGLTRLELLATTLPDLIPERFRARHQAMFEQFMKTPRTRPMGLGHSLNLYGLRRERNLQGEIGLVEVPVDISLSPFVSPKGVFAVAILRRREEGEAPQV